MIRDFRELTFPLRTFNGQSNLCSGVIGSERTNRRCRTGLLSAATQSSTQVELGALLEAFSNTDWRTLPPVGSSAAHAAGAPCKEVIGDGMQLEEIPSRLEEAMPELSGRLRELTERIEYADKR